MSARIRCPSCDKMSSVLVGGRCSSCGAAVRAEPVPANSWWAETSRPEQQQPASPEPAGANWWAATATQPQPLPASPPPVRAVPPLPPSPIPESEAVFADLIARRAAPTTNQNSSAVPSALSVKVWALTAIIGGCVLLLGISVVLALYFSKDNRGKQEEKVARPENTEGKKLPPQKPESDPVPSPTPPVVKREKQPDPPLARPPDVPPEVKPPIILTPAPMPPKKPDDPVPVNPSPFKPLPAEDQRKVNQAIERGIVYLKACLEDGGTAGRDVTQTIIGPVSIQHIGATTLTGLTLLACGVPANDPAIQKVISRVRSEGPTEINTYVLSIMIQFLDQLDDKEDRALIQTLAVRLLAGQNIRGGWPYSCPKVSVADQERLVKFLQVERPLSNDEAALRTQLCNRYGGVPVLTYKLGQKVDSGMPVAQSTEFDPKYDDNSTTQFAILALWAAQKAGIPVDKSLAMAEMRFRSLQNANGSWGYNKMYPDLWCDSMTCAGLMGLAAGRGVPKQEGSKLETRGLSHDPQVKRALAFLANTIGKPGIKRAAPPTTSGRNNRLFGSTAEEDIFFLWSLERMSVIYNLEKIDGKEWYPWAAKLLVEAQRDDGSWLELYGSAPNTCFALLVLRRVNVVKDLTIKLQKLELLDMKKDP